MIIAVTAVINLPASGGRKEFVYDCGVIGLCPPCTRATPLAGVGSLLVGGWGREPCAHAPESKPTRQQGSCALLMGGWGAGALPTVNPPANRDSVPCWQGGVLPRVNPPTNRDPVPCWRVGLLPGACAQGSLLHPPTSREPTPARGVALVHGGQRPISLEYQINPPSTHI